MKQKTLLIMTLLSTLLGCGNKISGPDFDHQENKVIVLHETFRVDYKIPGNLSLFLNFAEKHKKQPRSINISNIKNATYEIHDWREIHTFDNGMWEYYRGKRNVERNIAARLSLSISIQKLPEDSAPLESQLQSIYDIFLDGKHGLNTNTRNNYPDYTDDELSSELISPPEFMNIKINNIDFTHWNIYGELDGRHLQYFITPINKTHYIALRFKYYFTAKNDSELNKLEIMIPSDIDSFMSQLHISKL